MSVCVWLTVKIVAESSTQCPPKLPTPKTYKMYIKCIQNFDLNRPTD